jgi:hypothetical protein
MFRLFHLQAVVNRELDQTCPTPLHEAIAPVLTLLCSCFGLLVPPHGGLPGLHRVRLHHASPYPLPDPIPPDLHPMPRDQTMLGPAGILRVICPPVFGGGALLSECHAAACPHCSSSGSASFLLPAPPTSIPKSAPRRLIWRPAHHLAALPSPSWSSLYPPPRSGARSRDRHEHIPANDHPRRL